MNGSSESSELRKVKKERTKQITELKTAKETFHLIMRKLIIT